MDVILVVVIFILAILMYLREEEFHRQLVRCKTYNYEKGYKDGLYQNVIKKCSDDKAN